MITLPNKIATPAAAEKIPAVEPENGISNNRRERKEHKDDDFRSMASQVTSHLTEELPTSSAASPTDLLCALCVLCGFLQRLFPG